MTEIKEIRAKIYVFRSDEGGRKSGIFSGYHPGVYWDGLEEMGGNDGQLILEGKDKCLPGEECIGRIEFYHREFLPRSLKVGTTFTMREGGRIVGRGEVMAVSL